MSYENLAVKYRPKNFEEVMGQDTIKRTLSNSAKLGRLAHAYVFYGPRGCGKTTIARILAKTLNCREPKDGKPCDKCPSCLEIAESKSLDVIEVDAASNTDVDHVRNVIIEHVDLSPSRDKYKVYILDEVHMLSKQAFNALLKTIEEPPAHVVFVMATTEQAKVPLTILSRSQCFRFRPIPEELIAERLKEVAEKEKFKTSDVALAIIAKAAGGAMRDALTLLDRAASFGKGSVQTEVLNELLGHASEDLIVEVAAALVKRDQAALYSGFEKIAKEGYDPLTVLRDLRNTAAETFFYRQGFSKIPTALAGVLDKDVSPAALARISRKINAVIDEVKFSDAPLLAAEIALFTLVETPQDLDALVKRLEALEGGVPAASVLDRNTKGTPGPNSGIAPASQDIQKKNEKIRATPEKPAIAPSGPARPGFVPEQSLPSSAVWKRLLSAIAAKKPVLYNILLSAKIVFDQDDSPGADAGQKTWKLCSANKFESDIILKAKDDLEEISENITGRRISFVVLHSPGSVSGDNGRESPCVDEPSAGGGTELPTDTVSEAVEIIKSGLPEEQLDPVSADMKWEDAGDPKPAEEEAELKKLSKVFHGRITRIQKIK